MKVIKKVNEKSFKVKCTGYGTDRMGCNSILSLNKKDIIEDYYESYSWPYGIYSYKFFRCPLCGVKTHFEGSTKLEIAKDCNGYLNSPIVKRRSR